MVLLPPDTKGYERIDVMFTDNAPERHLDGSLCGKSHWDSVHRTHAAQRGAGDDHLFTANGVAVAIPAPLSQIEGVSLPAFGGTYSTPLTLSPAVASYIASFISCERKVAATFNQPKAKAGRPAVSKTSSRIKPQHSLGLSYLTFTQHVSPAFRIFILHSSSRASNVCALPLLWFSYRLDLCKAHVRISSHDFLPSRSAPSGRLLSTLQVSTFSLVVGDEDPHSVVRLPLPCARSLSCLLEKSYILCSSLMELDLRGCCLGASGCRTLAPALAQLPLLESLGVAQCCLFEEKALDTLLGAFRSTSRPRLTSLDLSGNDLCGNEMTSLEALLRHFCDALTSLDLSYNFLDGADGSGSALTSLGQCIFEAMPRLLRIDVSCCSMRELGTQSILSGVAPIALTRMNFGKNHMCLAGLEAVLRLISMVGTSVVFLDLSYNFLEGDGGILFAQNGLAFLPALTELNLSGNKIGDRGLMVLVPQLLSHQRLQRLDLSNNIMGERTATSIGSASLPLSQLRWLDLSYNSLGAAGLRLLLSWLSHCCPELEDVKLQYNNLRDNGCAMLCQEEFASCWRERWASLHLSDNCLSSSSLSLLAATLGQGPLAAKRCSALNISDNLADSFLLTSLPTSVLHSLCDLQVNRLSFSTKDSLDAFLAALSEMKCIEKLGVRECFPANEAAPYFVASFASTLAQMSRLCELDFSGNATGTCNDMMHLASGLGAATSIRQVRLSEMEVGNSDAEKVGVPFAVFTQFLTKLSQSWQAAPMTRPPLTFLDISDNRLSLAWRWTDKVLIPSSLGAKGRTLGQGEEAIAFVAAVRRFVDITPTLLGIDVSDSRIAFESPKESDVAGKRKQRQELMVR